MYIIIFEPSACARQLTRKLFAVIEHLDQKKQTKKQSSRIIASTEPMMELSISRYACCEIQPTMRYRWCGWNVASARFVLTPSSARRSLCATGSLPSELVPLSVVELPYPFIRGFSCQGQAVRLERDPRTFLLVGHHWSFLSIGPLVFLVARGR